MQKWDVVRKKLEKCQENYNVRESGIMRPGWFLFISLLFTTNERLKLKCMICCCTVSGKVAKCNAGHGLQLGGDMATATGWELRCRTTARAMGWSEALI